ncbi:DUF6279 family lipoprotein [Ketobacter sp.]
MSQIQRISILIILSLLLSGCGVRFVYNQLDWIIPWYLDDYMELDGRQEDAFRSDLDRYLAWHRTEQLPLYAQFLNQVADEAETGLSVDDIARVQLQSEQFAATLVERMKPDLIELFATATDEQVDQLFEKFNKENAKYRKEYVDVPEQKQRQQWQKEVIRYAERWTGDLNKDQLALIRKWSEQFALMGEGVGESRLAWQAEFRRILQLRTDRAAYEKAFVALLDNPQFGRSPELQQKMDANSDLLINLYLNIDKSLTTKQRTKAVAKLRDYADDFVVLAKQ